MHPFFDTAQKIGILLLGWSLLAAGLCILLSTLTGATLTDALLLFAPLYFLFLVLILPNYYVCQGLPLGETSVFYLIGSHALTLLAVLVIWYLAGVGYVRVLGSFGDPVKWRSLFDSVRFINLGVVGVQFEIVVLLHYLYFAIDKTRRLEQAALQQKLLISQAELQTLKATVHPHFLFNSLNTLSNIALSDPEKAHRFCLLLAEFLRYSVAYSRKSSASLRDELEHVQNYLGIERERFGERLETVFEIDDEVLGAQVPPMVLFPIVENAIKHGIDSRLEGGVLKVNVRRNNDTLVIEIDNPVDELGRKQRGTGHGLAAAEQRLKNRYGERARLKKEAQTGQFTVSLYIPIETSVSEQVE